MIIFSWGTMNSGVYYFLAGTMKGISTFDEVYLRSKWRVSFFFFFQFSENGEQRVFFWLYFLEGIVKRDSIFEWYFLRTQWKGCVICWYFLVVTVKREYPFDIFLREQWTDNFILMLFSPGHIEESVFIDDNFLKAQWKECII